MLFHNHHHILLSLRPLDVFLKLAKKCTGIECEQITIKLNTLNENWQSG
jgi:hypothetical protein